MPVKIFICYAREDEQLLTKLKAHLSPLQRQGLVETWYDRDISAGTEWAKEIDKNLNEAQIVLLLVSPDFMASDYCYSNEMKQALKRHEQGEVQIIPVILRPVYWQETPLSQFQALPTDGKPVIGYDWHTPDNALLDVTLGIREVISQIQEVTSKLISEGILFLVNRRPADALASFEKAIRLNPNEAEAFYNKYTALMWLGNEKEALDALNKSSDLGIHHFENVSLRLFVNDFGVAQRRYRPEINLSAPKTKINHSRRKKKR